MIAPGFFILGLLAAFCLPAQAGEFTLLVPARTIYPGEAVAALVEKTFSLADSRLGNWVTDPAQVRGLQAKRTLVAGKPIAMAALKQPDAVTRGKPARALYRSEGIEIATLLVPLDDAPAGAMVRARNPDSGIVVEALVLDSGELLVAAR